MISTHKYIITFLSTLLFICPYLLYGQDKIWDNDTIKNIRLHEVVVTATQRSAPGTSSIIGQDAIRHIQASDLSDLSQLLPGVPTHNPNLNAPTTFTIRSATYENTVNALGTAILVDGTRMNNNTNMQLLNLEYGGALFNSSALSGFDLRSLSPASIESVEVIRGIPSARYGDMTSGAVIVNSKASVQPFHIGLRFTATEKLASISKGMKLGNNSGTLYLGTDYALSTQDYRLPEQTFQRFSIQTAYSKDFTASTLRLNMRGYWLQNKKDKGKNMVEGEYMEALDRGFSFSANGRWKPKNALNADLDYHAGITYGSQYNESSTYYSGIQQVATYTTQAGEQEAMFLPPHYFTYMTVKGKPLNAEISLIANFPHTLYNKVDNHLQTGIEFTTEGNRGEGIQFDPMRPPLGMERLRTRSYRDVPFVYHYTTFAENKLSFHTGKTTTELQAGIRITKLLTQSLRYAPVADPRINVRQTWGNVSLRAGWGLLHKMPLLAYLYPAPSYTDKNCFTYNDTENDNRLAVMHTFVTDRTFNPKLRLPVNRKVEIGVNFKIKNITADIVWFNERLRNGYCSTQCAVPFTYRRYEPLINKGEQPLLTANGIISNGVPLSYNSNTTFALYSTPQNGIEQKKTGIEYTFDFGQWRPLHSSLLINGSYLKMTEKNNAFSDYHPQIEVNGQPYPYAGIYKGGTSGFNRQTWERLSTRFLCITQLPRLGLITTLTLQAIWIDKQQYTGNTLHAGEQNQVIPVYYIDGKGEIHPFTPEMATDKRFTNLILYSGPATAHQTDSFGPYFLLNLRITKKIGSHVTVAFCANNFTASRPKRYTNSTGQYTILNPELYYGAEIVIKI